MNRRYCGPARQSYSVAGGFTRRIGGFTLIELLIVVALIAILFIAGIVGYRLQLLKAKDAIRKRDLNNLKVAFEHYYTDYGCYPPASYLNNCGGDDLMPYLDKIPCDPDTNIPYSLTLSGGSCASKYFISSTLANSRDPQITCNDKYLISSPNASPAEIESSCKGTSFCAGGYYGCVSGQCRLISAISKPACSPLFCASNCQDSCGLPGWELYPYPCEI